MRTSYGAYVIRRIHHRTDVHQPLSTFFCVSNLEHAFISNFIFITSSSSIPGIMFSYFRHESGTGHPTIKSVEQGLSILARFAKDFVRPDSREGYDRILYLQPQHFPNAGVFSDPNSSTLGAESHYSKSEISSILHQIRSSPAMPPPSPLAPFTVPAASPSDSSTSSSVFNSRGTSGSVSDWQKPRYRSPTTPSRRMAPSHYGVHGPQDSNLGQSPQLGFPSPLRETRYHSYGQSQGNWRDASRINSPHRGRSTQVGTITHPVGVAGAPPGTRTDVDGYTPMAQYRPQRFPPSCPPDVAGITSNEGSNLNNNSNTG